VSTGVDKAIGRSVVALFTRLGTTAVRRRRRALTREQARTLIPSALADRALTELDPALVRPLSRFVASPQFEHLALQMLFTCHPEAGRREQEEIVSSVRQQLRHSLRHAVAPPEEDLPGLTDLVLDALTMQLTALDPALVRGTSRQLSGAAQIAAMGCATVPCSAGSVSCPRSRRRPTTCVPRWPRCTAPSGCGTPAPVPTSRTACRGTGCT